MADQTCKNCGAWYGLHHYETNQCPKNGRETNPQMWETTTYQEEDKSDSKIADLEAQIANQGQTIEQLARIIREYKTSSEMGVKAIKAQAAEIEDLNDEIERLQRKIEQLEYDDYEQRQNID